MSKENTKNEEVGCKSNSCCCCNDELAKFLRHIANYFDQK
jgi:hypothetical protein